MTPLEELRHSASHVLATALLRLFPDAKLDIGPPTDTGFYYDIDLEHKLTAEDLAKIEAEMKKVAEENQPFLRKEVSREEAAEIIKSRGQERYKLGRLADIPEGEKISFYQNGEFMDLCAGTHVRYSSKVKAFKLLSVAGAYHRGSEKNKQLQRIYGTAFPTKDELAQYLEQMEQAKHRDHRKLGKDLKLFVIDEDVGQGLILWTPNGSIIRQELQNFISEELRKQGYSQVFTPHIGKLELYKISGHFPYYKDSQFTPVIENESLAKILKEGCSCAEMVVRLDAVSSRLAAQVNARTGVESITPDRVRPDDQLLDGFMLKPMNCPHHIKIFASQPHSYRDLPVRLAEFGTVYRWEQSGELNGMTRVRGFTQDDAHLFCTEDQVAAEVLGCLSLVKIILSTLGMNDYRVRVGLRDPRLKQVHGPQGELGQGRGRLPRRGEDTGRRVHGGARRGRVLRAEDRLHGQGRDRARVAAGDGPGGLQPARPIRPHLQRRRQPAPPPRHDPQGALRLDGALLRRPDRALRRRLPRLAFTGAGAPGAHQREDARLRA